jgi:hypothetical protein
MSPKKLLNWKFVFRCIQDKTDIQSKIGIFLNIFTKLLYNEYANGYGLWNAKNRRIINAQRNICGGKQLHVLWEGTFLPYTVTIKQIYSSRLRSRRQVHFCLLLYQRSTRNRRFKHWQNPDTAPRVRSTWFNCGDGLQFCYPSQSAPRAECVLMIDRKLNRTISWPLSNSLNIPYYMDINLLAHDYLEFYS